MPPCEVLRLGAPRLYPPLRRTGLRDEPRHRAFLAAYEAAITESSIFAHEGRHAIDGSLNLNAPDDEWEYRARLSAVAFAPVPRLAPVGDMITSSIGSASDHGKANTRLMTDLVGRMRTHVADSRGVDASRPLLPQLDRLSDAQVRNAFVSLDPLAPRRRNPGRSGSRLVEPAPSMAVTR